MCIKLKIYSIAILHFIYIKNANSQTNPQDFSSLDNKYTPSGAILILTKESEKPEKYNYEYPKNIIKITPTQAFRGLISLVYERNLTPSISANGGIGFNFNKDIIYTYIGSEINPIEDVEVEEDVMPINTLMYKSEHYVSSPSYLFGVRFINEVHQNNYNFIEFSYFSYANKLIYNINANNSERLISNNLINVNHSIFNMKIGFQLQSSRKIKIIHELYMAAGVRKTKYNIVTTNKAYNFIYNRNEELTEIKDLKKATLNIYFSFGYALCLGF